MSVSIPSIFETTPIRVWFRPYSHQEVKEFLRRVHDEFGLGALNMEFTDRRWAYCSPKDDWVMAENNVWVLDFYFRDDNNRILFALKYQR